METSKSATEKQPRGAIEQVEALITEPGASDDAETFGSSVETPDDWDGTEEWKDKIEPAREQASISASREILTATINGREYYDLQ